MILVEAKNPGKLCEDTADAGWVRVERGVRATIACLSISLSALVLMKTFCWAIEIGKCEERDDACKDDD